MTRVLILHNELPADAAASELDVLVQVEAVREALCHLGYPHSIAACGLDLEQLRGALERERPDVVFNLVESLGGHDRLLFLVPALLDALAIPYTGSGTEALLVSTGKLTTRRRLTEVGVPMPRLAAIWPSRETASRVPYQVIVKSAWQHGSLGLDELCILEAGRDLRAALAQLAPRLGGVCLAEQFIDGRELNLSLIEREGVWTCLPPAEIRFDSFAPGKPRIVGQDAKWQEDSYEYRETPRSFDFPPADRPMLERAERIAYETVVALGLAGWARVDLRIGSGSDGNPGDARGSDVWVLEANANPCLSPDAGFAAALARGGIEWPEAVESILRSAQSQVAPSSAALPEYAAVVTKGGSR